MEGNMPGIGILSSIEYNADMRRHFEAGVRSILGPPLPPINSTQVSVGFDPAALRTAIAAMTGFDLIVTFGGFFSCQAAILNSTTPFISLVGGVPEVLPPFGRFVGCCSLESHSHHQGRINWLSNPANVTAGHFPAGAAFLPANIGLLYNPNAKMVIPELSHWQKAGGGPQVPVSAATLSTPSASTFLADFNSFAANVQAVVISADPFFHTNREFLISAANTFVTVTPPTPNNRYICYPLRSYRTAATAHATYRVVFIGPDHPGAGAPSDTNAYYRMGVMAATYLSNNPVPPLELIPQAIALPV